MANSAVDVSARTGIVPFFAEITGFDPYPWQCGRHEALRRGQPPASLDIPSGLAKHSGKNAAGRPGLHTATPTPATGWEGTIRVQ